MFLFVNVSSTRQFSLLIYIIFVSSYTKWKSFDNYGETPYITYSKGQRRVVVILQCTNSGEKKFEFLGVFTPDNYVFQLTHKCACWNACSSM